MYALGLPPEMLVIDLNYYGEYAELNSVIIVVFIMLAGIMADFHLRNWIFYSGYNGSPNSV